MSTTAVTLPALESSSDGTQITYRSVLTGIGTDTYTVTLAFPLPRSSRTCIDGSHGKAYPHVRLRSVNGAMTVNWHIGGRASLPADVNDAVAALFKEAVKIEAVLAGIEGVPPVPESVLERFRCLDPDTTVEEAREAALASESMIRDLGMAADSTALWIARNRVRREVHESTLEIVANLEDDVEQLAGELKDLERQAARDTTPEPDARAIAVLDALSRLRSHGRTLLEYQVGDNDLDKVIDYLDSAAGWDR